ncbi:hypothetical protein ACFXKY_03985, partial [Streptomyces canus]|uniref:hypothetical protein n=1 Tax=Streptomyces canus TaxID=58343 RepID=UPI0036946C02
SVGTPLDHAGIDRLRAHTSLGLATALEHCGDPTEAHELYRTARDLFTAFGDTASAAEARAGAERLGHTG